MKYPTIPLAQQVIQLCHIKGIRHVVISPGSRNAPLTIGFASHNKIKTYSIVDERCAAFFALGIAQQLQEPTAIVCTSGSAMLNYYPAIAEAYYSDIPLVVITADRPKHLIDVGDGQTIRQEEVYKNHILYSANLKQDIEANNERYGADKNIPSFVLDKLQSLVKPQESYNIQEINKAINIATVQKGPVHINVPFAEPLYNTQASFNVAVSNILPEAPHSEINESQFKSFISSWEKSQKKMILIGVNTPKSIAQQYLDMWGNDPSVIVFTESTSNLHHHNFFPCIDKIIAPLSEAQLQTLQPEVLLTFGGMIVSKKIKAFLRRLQPKAHYHVDIKKAFDTFFCLTHHFKTVPNTFLERVNTAYELPTKGDYRDYWLTIKHQRTLKHKAYFENIPFTDIKVFKQLLPSIPNNAVLHLSNSSTIRYVQLFNDNPTVDQYCNRGTSGIDGSTSTALGHAVVSDKQHIIITGDLSFFYDSNALWNNYIPNSFRIIVINNSGGGIFRILPGNKNTEDFDTYFETKHNLNAKYLAAMFQFEYYTAHDEDTLITALDTFFVTGSSPKILEITTPRTSNDEVLIDYFKKFND